VAAGRLRQLRLVLLFQVRNLLDICITFLHSGRPQTERSFRRVGSGRLLAGGAARSHCVLLHQFDWGGLVRRV